MKLKKLLLIALVTSTLATQVFAATWDTSSTTWSTAWFIDSSSWEGEADKTSSNTSDANNVFPSAPNPNLSEGEPIDASNTSTNTSLALPKWNIWDYQEIACDKDYFTQNVCNQCFDWSKKAISEKISTLADTWINQNSTEQVFYKDEQINPEFINLGWNNTVWVTNPTDPNKFWKFANEIIWIDSDTPWTNKQEFVLGWNKSIKFQESDLWASYAMSSTDKQEWEPVGLLKFTINYHNINSKWDESVKNSHTECVAYYSAAPAPVATTPTPKAQEITKVKTWTESYILILIALVLWFTLVRLRKKNS